MKRKLKAKTYISELEFNRLVGDRGSSEPEEDSKGDSAVDETIEIQMGEQYPEEDEESLDETENEDQGHVGTEPNLDQQRIQDETTSQPRVRSSTWPAGGDLSK
jgi:hypothetical protein